MTTRRIGDIGELAIIKDLMMDERLDVYRPFCDDRGVDLLVDTPKGYKKVQIKHS